MQIIQKLEILSDAAKYDASCASSGTSNRTSLDGQGVGSSGGMGICHSYAPDGRCISLLKLLLTNFCIYECSYCVNRNSSNVQRARFSVDEVVKLTLDFYTRNYIEGLFLSSGVIQDADYTMEQLVEVARRLREEHDFRGYIHLKTIPDANGDLLARAGQYADRLSINVELPTRDALADLAPEKDHRTIKLSMARIRSRRDESKQRHQELKQTSNLKRAKETLTFAPAGQSTQMIVGAEPSTDAQILSTATTLYAAYDLRRVYFSAFSPIPDAATTLPVVQPPLQREHRLYQSDWLVRFYGFTADELTVDRSTSLSIEGMLDLDIDPKLSWALRHREQFPVDLNRASKEQLLRVPGIGTKTVSRLLRLRRRQRIKLEDLIAMRASVSLAMPFIQCANHSPTQASLDSVKLRKSLAAPQSQLGLAF